MLIIISLQDNLNIFKRYLVETKEFNLLSERIGYLVSTYIYYLTETKKFMIYLMYKTLEILVTLSGPEKFYIKGKILK